MKKILTLSFLISVSLTIYAQTLTLNDSLVTRYTFNRSNILDTVSSNHGSVTGPITFPMGGFDGRRVARFNGLNNSVATITNGIIPLNDDYTVSFWFGIDSFKTARQIILSSRKNSFGNEQGGIEFSFRQGTNDLNAVGRTINGGRLDVYEVTTQALQNQTSYHVALTHLSNPSPTGQNQIILYLNGVSVDTTFVTRYASQGSFWRMGAGIFGSGSSSSIQRAFGGILDDVRFYNRALSATEVNQLYNFTTSIEDYAEANSNLSIYPNPVDNYFYIEQNNLDLIELQLFNLNGQLMQSFRPSSSYDLSTLPSGAYIIRLITRDQIINQRLIKN